MDGGIITGIRMIGNATAVRRQQVVPVCDAGEMSKERARTGAKRRSLIGKAERPRHDTCRPRPVNQKACMDPEGFILAPRRQTPPVVLLHGFATSTERTWREPGWFDLLKDARRRAFGIDLLGHGEAAKPTDPADYDDLVTPVIEQFPESPADIVGYSLGARTALQIAMISPPP